MKYPIRHNKIHQAKYNKFEQMKIIFVFSCTIFLSSCSCLKTTVDNNNGITLTESNLTLLNGKYERLSAQSNDNSGDLYWTFFDRGHCMGSGFFELKVINKNKISVSYIEGNDTIKSKNKKGKIKNGYFEFRRKYFFIPGIFVNLYRDSKFRIKPSNDNDLLTDYKQISFGTSMFIIPFYEKLKENNMIFKQIENQTE